MLARFQEHGSLSKIHTVILSHLHFDHISDVTVPLRGGRGWSLQKAHIIRIYAPCQPENEFSLLTYKEATSGHAPSSGMLLQVGPLRLTFHQGVHGYLPCGKGGGTGSVLAMGDTRPVTLWLRPRRAPTCSSARLQGFRPTQIT